MARVKLDHKGIEEVMVGPGVTALIAAKAREVAANASAMLPSDVPVTVRAYEYKPKGRYGRRSARSVAIAHPSGLARQVKYGTLTKAAAAAGLEVRERRR